MRSVAAAVVVDIDEAAVTRAMSGERLPLSRFERIEVVRRLTARGLPIRVIAEITGKHHRQVSRDRQAMQVPFDQLRPRPGKARRRPEPIFRIASEVTPGRLPTCTGGKCSTCQARIRKYQLRRASA